MSTSPIRIEEYAVSDDKSASIDDDFSERDSSDEDLDDLPLLDLEAQPVVDEKSLLAEEDGLLQATTKPLEYAVPTYTKLLHLGCYFVLNLSLTLYNKAILGGFRFPWLMTAIHCSTVSIGCTGLLLGGVFSLSHLKTRENLLLVAFSFLFTLNIAISNVSLSLVSVPTHQILRSTSPALMVLTYRLIFGRSYSTQTYLTLVPIITGVGLATYGDYYFTLLGFCLTMLGVFLGIAKSIASNRIMTGSLKLSAYEVLLRMSPLAAIQSLFYCWVTGEAHQFMTFVNEGNMTRMLTLAVAGNGLVAFALNISSFQTNKVAGALTMTVAGNLKQCLTIILGIALFNVKIGPLNAIGMLVTVSGAAWYSKVELDSKGKRDSK